jgi:hypothetical protein
VPTHYYPFWPSQSFFKHNSKCLAKTKTAANIRRRARKKAKARKKTFRHVANTGLRKAHHCFLNHRLHRTQTAYNKLSILLEIRAYDYLYKAQDCLPFKADDCLPRQADRFPLRELYYYRPGQYLLYREDGYLDCRLTHDLK